MALALSLAVVTKLSMVSLVFILGLLGLIASLSTVAIPARVLGRPVDTVDSRGRKLLGLARILLASGLVAYGAIWTVYRFDYNAAASIGRPLEWSGLAAEGTLVAHALGRLRRTHALPEPYIYNFFYHVHVSRLFPGFLLGEVRQGG